MRKAAGDEPQATASLFWVFHLARNRGNQRWQIYWDETFYQVMSESLAKSTGLNNAVWWRFVIISFSALSKDSSMVLAAKQPIRYAGGKATEEWVNWDALGLLHQLGAVPPLGHTKGQAAS